MDIFYTECFSEIAVNKLTDNNSSSATASFTYSATGKDLDTTSEFAIKETNIASVNLANTLITLPEDDITTSISITTHTIEINNIVSGISYNVNNLFSVASKLFPNLNYYGANSTTNYYATIFNNITIPNDLFPVINVGPNDYMLYEIDVPDNLWLSNHNLFNITPYFYNYIQNNVIKICLTSSKKIGDFFNKKGYTISKIPIEYINSTTFIPLIRVGIIKEMTFNINDFVKTYYYKSPNNNINAEEQYYTSKDIIINYKDVLLPKNDIDFKLNLNNFDNIVSYLSSYEYKCTQTVKYLSNIYDRNYAFTDFYKAITIDTPAQLQANNTCENYFNSDTFDLTKITDDYVYVLSLNQLLMQTALTSNIQIYNRVNNKVINNGTIETSAELPVLNSSNYPVNLNNNLLYPLFQLNGYNRKNLISQGISTIMCVERLSYNPINYNHSSYEYTGKSYVIFGSKIDNDIYSYLESNYNISIKYNYNHL
jgi:hypothetical protein